MAKKDFKDYICRPFCVFFKEAQKEEMACRGAEVIELLVLKGRLIPSKLPRCGKISSLWNTSDPGLQARVCRHCPFQPEDCDFQSKTPPPNSEPCGGYILLSLLKKQRLIALVELETTAGE